MFDFFFSQNAEYKGDYNAQHPVIKIFWKVFHSLSIEQKKKFLCKSEISKVKDVERECLCY